MRVVECDTCGEALAADSDDELARRLLDHVEAEHPEVALDAARARETILAEAYDATDS